MRRLWRRLAETLRPGRREGDLAAELESHIELHVDEAVRRGQDPEAARRDALLALGGVEPTKERVRDQRRLRGLEMLGQDLRLAGRLLRKRPGFTAVVLLTFALGIGANTAIFATVNAVLLRPLPYPRGDELVMVWAIDQKAGDRTMPATPADFADWRARSHAFSALAASSDAVYALTGDGEPETVVGYSFAPEMFGVLGMGAALGRVFTDADGPDVVVLSDKLWRRRYHGDRDLIGRGILLDNKPYTVIGVMPPAFQHPKLVELWTPMVIPVEQAASRKATFLRIVGRLRPGVSVDDARAEMRSIAAALAAEHPESNGRRSADVVSLRQSYTGDARPALLVLLAAVGFVLLLATINIAGLSLARASTRRHELALRAALGAGRGRLVRQLLTESLLLAFLGCAAGLVVASWATGALVALFPRAAANIKMPILEHIALDGRVILFGLGAAVFAGLGSGLLPVLYASRTDLNAALKEDGRTIGHAGRARHVLVVGQLALAVVLCAGALLLLRSSTLRTRALGFDPDDVLTARVILDLERHPDAAERQALQDRLLERLRAVPGVEAAGIVHFLPLCGWSSGTTFFHPAEPTAPREAGLLVVAPGTFAAMRVPLLRGRDFDDRDRKDTAGVAIVDDRFARRFLAGADPVGMRLNFGSATEPRMVEIVGVAGAVTTLPPPEEQPPMVYRPFTQLPWRFWGLVVRSAGDPGAVAAAVRDAVWSLDPQQPVAYVMTMDALVADALAAQRISGVLLGSFAALALVMAGIGLYGLLAQTVVDRRREIGIRLALGATRGQVLAQLLRRLGLLTAIGIALGVPGALAGGKLLASLLYGVSPRDPLLLAGVVGMLAVLALLAAVLPLRRAARIDPLIALRQE